MLKVFALCLFVFAALPSYAKEELTIVPNKEVCMVNNTYFGKPQIPVQVAGKTYYGCCEGCKKTLAEDAGARTASDALTNAPIDKATAVIAKKADDTVLYFASKENFKKYSQKK